MSACTVPEGILVDKRHKNWFWDSNSVFDSDLSANAKLVRLYLARRADEERKAWPSYNRIAKDCGVSRDTAKRAIAELLEKGWIQKIVREKDSGEHISNVYILCDPPAAGSAQNDEDGGGCCEHPPCSESTGGVGAVSTHPVINQQGVGAVNDKVGAVSTHVGAVSTQVGAEAAPNNTHITIPREEIPREEKEMLLSSLRSDNNISGPALRAPSAVVPPERPFSDPEPYRAVNRPKKRDSRPQAGEADEASNVADSRMLIAELVQEYRTLGVEEKAGDYAFIGALYNSKGYERVLWAISELEAAMAIQDIKKPLLYLKAILEVREKNRVKAGDARKVKDEADTNKRKELIKKLYLT